MDNSILDVFNYFKTILCMCPECNSIMRLSDLHLRSHSKSPRTWLDTYETKTEELDEKEGKFEEEERTLREQARTKGRDRVKELVKSFMNEEFRLPFNPYDIKAVLHPVDFAVFNGMNDDMVRDIVLMSKRTSNPYMASLHKDVKNVIKSKSYDWKVVRVSKDGDVGFE